VLITAALMPGFDLTLLSIVSHAAYLDMKHFRSLMLHSAFSFIDAPFGIS
jgi:hypothetical protein